MFISYGTPPAENFPLSCKAFTFLSAKELTLTEDVFSPARALLLRREEKKDYYLIIMQACRQKQS